MSTITYTSELTVERIKRKHDKDSMARLLFDTYNLLDAVDNKHPMDDEHEKLIGIQTRIAWG